MKRFLYTHPGRPGTTFSLDEAVRSAPELRAPDEPFTEFLQVEIRQPEALEGFMRERLSRLADELLGCGALYGKEHASPLLERPETDDSDLAALRIAAANLLVRRVHAESTTRTLTGLVLRVSPTGAASHTYWTNPPAPQSTEAS